MLCKVQQSCMVGPSRQPVTSDLPLASGPREHARHSLQDWGKERSNMGDGPIDSPRTASKIGSFISIEEEVRTDA